MNNLVITQYENFICSGFFNDFTLMECDLSPDDGDCVRVGDVYVGYVENISKPLNAAFVRIRPGVNGYYSLDTNKSHLFLSNKNTDKICIGDRILVQVKSEAIKSKPFSLSGTISIPGVFCVAVSDSSKVMISKQISNKQMCSDFKEALLPLLKPECGGLIVRTNAKDAPIEKVIGEARQLLGQLYGLLDESRHQALYTRLFTGYMAYENYVYDYVGGTFEKVITDIPKVYEQLIPCAKMTGLKLELYTDSYPLKSLYNFDRQIEKALMKKVWLDSGGFLVIEPTEALTVIDVNSGKYQGKKSDMGEYNYKINLEAAGEIARQLRLRNLSGIIIIDFINMYDDGLKKQLVKELTELVSSDKVVTSVVDITSLGLVEMTRKKIRRPLHEVIYQERKKADSDE